MRIDETKFACTLYVCVHACMSACVYLKMFELLLKNIVIKELQIIMMFFSCLSLKNSIAVSPTFHM